MIKKAIIPAGGLGLRFLPITKSVTKEMLPIVDKPALQLIIEELVFCGIEEVVLVIAQNKTEIKKHFSPSSRVENALIESGKTEQLAQMRKLNKLMRITYITQEKPKGLADAIYLARRYFNAEDYFLVALGDNIVKPGLSSDTAKMLKQFQAKNANYIATNKVSLSEIERYGSVKFIGYPKSSNSCICKVCKSNLKTRAVSWGRIEKIIEKPKKDIPSQYAVFGRYIFNNKIFAEIEKLQNAELGSEILLTDAINNLTEYQQVYASEYKKEVFDVGDKLGYLKANCSFALDNPALKASFIKYIKTLYRW